MGWGWGDDWGTDLKDSGQENIFLSSHSPSGRGRGKEEEEEFQPHREGGEGQGLLGPSLLLPTPRPRPGTLCRLDLRITGRQHLFLDAPVTVLFPSPILIWLSPFSICSGSPNPLPQSRPFMNLLPFPYTLLKLLGLKISKNPFHRVKTPLTMASAKGSECAWTVEGNSGVSLRTEGKVPPFSSLTCSLLGGEQVRALGRGAHRGLRVL